MLVLSQNRKSGLHNITFNRITPIKMNDHVIYKILLVVIRLALVLLLFVLPVIYSIWRGNWTKSFRFTWFVWVVVIFVFGILAPALANLTEKLTGEPADVGGFGFIGGIVIGWLPGIIFASIGTWVHGLIWKRNTVA